MPAQLVGDWFLPAAAVDALITCPKPLTLQTCNLGLSLMATSYRFHGTLPPGAADVVVNNTEMDFFNERYCQQGPEGVGRYAWTLTGGVLRFTPLNVDPCERGAYLRNQSFYRTP
ncbi:MAG: hypothetical protein PVS3B2_08560 [Candidatus Dormibacteraceae bacterium]